jgi:CRP/FNR family cyclic AMP-dependent transcriptional regulator
MKQNPLLRGFSDDGVRIIQAATTERSLGPGSPIYVEKMHGESAFLLLDGSVELYVSRPTGEKILGVLHAPDHFGDFSLLAPGPRRISARAASSVVLLEVPRRDFQNLQKQRPQACLKLMMNIVDAFGQRAGAAGSVFDRLTDLA